MAGAPKKRAVLAELERRAKATSTEDAPMESALDYVVDYVASGGTMRALAAEVGDLSAASVTRALYRRFGEDEVKKRLAGARMEGAHGLAEKAIERAQTITDKDDAPGARVEVGALQWTAERWNRDQFGAQPKVAVVNQMSLGAAHLDALRQIARRDRELENRKLEALPAEIITSENFGDKLIEAVAEAVEIHEGRMLPARVDVVDGETSAPDATHAGARSLEADQSNIRADTPVDDTA